MSKKEQKPLTCHVCGEAFTIDDNGVAQHSSDDGYELDAQHVPYDLESDN